MEDRTKAAKEVTNLDMDKIKKLDEAAKSPSEHLWK